MKMTLKNLTENVDLKVQNIIQQKIIGAHAAQSESESYNCEI